MAASWPSRRHDPVNLLALDLATRSGWALLEHGRIESGVETFDVKRGESSGMRYIRFNRWLDDMLWPTPPIHRDRPRVELIVFEQAHQRGGAATEVAAGFATRVLECCARHTIEHAAVHTATLKKFTTGRGNADKAAMLEAVGRRWRRVETDDEADAVALLYYALTEIVPAQTSVPSAMEAAAKIADNAAAHYANVTGHATACHMVAQKIRDAAQITTSLAPEKEGG